MPEFCSNCGKQLKAGAKFCENCGKAVPEMMGAAQGGKPAVQGNKSTVQGRNHAAGRRLGIAAAILFASIAIVAAVIISQGWTRKSSSEDEWEAYVKDITEYVSENEEISEVGLVQEDKSTEKEATDSDRTEVLAWEWPTGNLASRLPRPWFGKVQSAKEEEDSLTVTLDGVLQEYFTDYRNCLMARGYTLLQNTFGITEGENSADFYSAMSSSGLVVDICLEEDGGIMVISIKNMRTAQ